MFQCLNYSDWCSMTSVSKHFNRIASDEKLWDRYVFVVKAEGGPSPRVCHSSVLYKSKMYIFGGHNPDPGSNLINDLKNELFELDFKTNTWRQIEGPNFPYRTEHSSVCTQGRMLIFGGYSGLGGYKNDIVVCDLENGFKWETIPPKGDFPSARSAHSICLYNNKVFLFGGWDGRTSNNNFYKFNISKGTWKKVKFTGQPPDARRSHGAVVIDDSMFIFGGYDGQRNVPPVLHRFNFTTKSWSTEEAKGQPPCGRSRTKVLHYHNTIAVFGGWDRVNHFQKWHEYNLETRTWHERDVDFPGKGVGQHSAVIYNNTVYVFGGYHEAIQSSSNLLWGYFLGHLGRQCQA